MIGHLVLLKTYDMPGPFQVKYYRPKPCCCFLTPGNVVRGGQVMLRKSLRQLAVMTYVLFTECQQIYFHGIYYVRREKIDIWFRIAFICLHKME